MHVTVTCPKCSCRLRLNRDCLSGIARCPRCMTDFTLRATSDGGAVSLALVPPPTPLKPPPVFDASPADTKLGDASAPGEEFNRVPTAAFVVVVRSDPDGRLEGRFEAEVCREGLRVWRGRGHPLHIPRRSKARYLGGTGLLVEIEGRKVELNVVRGDGNPENIARAVVNFLTGATREFQLPRSRAMPLLLFALIPLLMPVLAFVFGDRIGGFTGGFVWGIIGLALSAIAVFFSLQLRWTWAARSVPTFGIMGLGLLVFFIIFIADLATSQPAIRVDRWTEIDAPPGGGYRVRMPFAPTRMTLALNGFTGTGLQISVVRVFPQRAVFLTAHGDFDGSGYTLEKRVRLVQRSLMEVSGTHSVGQREFTVDGKKVHEWTGEGDEVARSILHIRIIDQRLYAVLGACVREKDVAAVKEFVNTIDFDADLELAINDDPDPEPEVRAGPPPVTTALGEGGLLFETDGNAFVWAGFARSLTVGVARDGSIRRWDDAGMIKSSLRGRARDGLDIDRGAVSPDGTMLALIRQDSVVLLVRLGSGKVLHRVPCRKTDSVWSVVFSPDGTTLAMGHNSGTVSLRNTNDGKLRETLKIADKPVLSVIFSADGKALAVADSGRVVRVYELPAGKLIATCTGHQEPAPPREGVRRWDWSIRSLAFACDGRTLASAGNDGTVRLWNAFTGEQKHVLRHGEPVTALAFHPSGRLVFTACTDGRLRAWDTSTGNRRSLFRNDAAIPADLVPQSLACDDGGSALAVVYGNRVERWDLNRAGVLRNEDRAPLPAAPSRR
jgi:WD40 repeat protein